MPFHPPHVVDIMAQETIRSLASLQPRNIHLNAVLQRDPEVFPLPRGPVRYAVTLTRWRGARRFRIHTATALVEPEAAIQFHELVFQLLAAALKARPVKPPNEACYGAPPSF